MMKYCFILGKNPLLSLIEILSLAKIRQLEYKVLDITSEIFVIESKKIDLNTWHSRLGGTIKIGEILDTTENLQSLQDLLASDKINRYLSGQKDKKNIFGFSLYGELATNLNKKINKIGYTQKKLLQKKGYKIRYVEAKENALTSVQVNKNKMISRGADIIIASGLHNIYIGRSLSIQDFENYSLRDYGRPVRDAKSGMIPPKLAKIMINLSQLTLDKKILDPFCGSGTIIHEALLMGYENMIGSDISHQAIQNSKKNTDWLIGKFNLKNSDINFFVSDVVELNNNIDSNSVDAIITEPYLGPPLNKNITLVEIESSIKELEKLYLDSFKTFDKLLKHDGQIIIIFPLLKTSFGTFVLKILEELEKNGFMRINPFPDSISLFAKIGPTARGSLIYQRPDQMVHREIFIFRRKKS